MKTFKIIAGIFILLVVAGFALTSRINTIQRDGEITLKSLKAPVKIVRDEKGMPYIHAETLADAITAQGFVTAQDRLHQLEIIRLNSHGRYSELGGESKLKQDIFFRSLGFLRNARKHAKILNSESRQFIQWYANGINEYISQMKGEYPFEMRLAKLTADPWTVEDVISVLYMIGFSSSGNHKSEMLFSKLFQKLGPAGAMDLMPINIGPQCTFTEKTKKVPENKLAGLYSLLKDVSISYNAPVDTSYRVGSNSWVVGPKRTKNNAPILAGDPHLKTNRIPTTWYPTGIITPEYRMVGTGIPGSPGFYNLRTNYIAIGLTNSYIDCQDVYVEILDPKNPENYLEGAKSIPFTIIMETFKIRDKKESSGYREIQYPVMLTKRGPVIFKSDKIAMTLRWSPMEKMTPELAMYDIIRSKSVSDIKKALSKETMHFFNRTFVDKDGSIGWHTTGPIPVRSQKTGAYPQQVKDSRDNWIGWIPFEKMPHSYNPPQAWIGTANNMTVDSSYPYYTSSNFGSYYRYARMKEIMDSAEDTTIDDHMEYQRDTKNIMAEHTAPTIVKILSSFEDTKELGETLAGWDFHDDKDRSAPAVFQIVIMKAALLTFKDELGEDLAREMLGDWYFWQTRFEKMLKDGSSPWFDVKSTEDVESMKDIIHQAGLEAIDQYGDGPEWGDLHVMEFLNFLIFEGPLKSLVDAGSYPMSGSGETLYRARYEFNKPFAPAYTASLRMVADMSDNEKVLAVLPGGTSGRIFDKHYKDQVEAFMKGEKKYWWLSDELIKEHTESTLVLKPGK